MLFCIDDYNVFQASEILIYSIDMIIAFRVFGCKVALFDFKSFRYAINLFDFGTGMNMRLQYAIMQVILIKLRKHYFFNEFIFLVPC